MSEAFEFAGDDGNGNPKWMWFRCQNKSAEDGDQCCVALRPSQKNAVGASWQWDGNKEKPTITPSINCAGCWHGWIRNGEFVTA